jgi:endonuclease/exonuclease/phosphatase family metal-dependent hydrolase
MVYNYGYTIYFQDGKYGNGILSRDTPIIISNEELNIPERRKFMVAEFKDYVFIATHLDNEDEEYRIRSVRQINSFIEARYGDYNKPVFLAGDLNEPNLNSEMYEVLLDKWDIISTQKHGTYIGNGSNDVIDYILLWKTNQHRIIVIGTTIPKFDGIDIAKVSDHLPVIVDIKDDFVCIEQ